MAGLGETMKKSERELAIEDIVAERDELRLQVSGLLRQRSEERNELAYAIARLTMENYRLKDVISMRDKE